MSLNFAPIRTSYQYKLEDRHIPWVTKGKVEFRRDLVRLFRTFTVGGYTIAICIRTSDGACVHLGERMVSAPLEREDMLDYSGKGEPIMPCIDKWISDAVEGLEICVRSEKGWDRKGEEGVGLSHFYLS